MMRGLSPRACGVALVSWRDCRSRIYQTTARAPRIQPTARRVCPTLARFQKAASRCQTSIGNCRNRFRKSQNDAKILA